MKLLHRLVRPRHVLERDLRRVRGGGAPALAERIAAEFPPWEREEEEEHAADQEHREEEAEQLAADGAAGDLGVD